MDSLVDVGLAADTRYISGFHTYGVSRESRRWQLHSFISIDWDEHARLIVTNSTVAVDDRWLEGENPGLVEQADRFTKLLADLDLEPRFMYTVAPQWRSAERWAEAGQRLGIPLKRSDIEPDGQIERGERNRPAGLAEVSFVVESAFPD